ncbi:toll/interleukin-1 receptor domain-containing protein [Parafrankia discariae]|uniref:toll/interleukin-1 receptor domain-containing protein n=1 Tax=Parafrankia discariae TaxID=365528 RepID=UPI0003A655FF|nr:toll/interleukin-1 receptor domain-containing protein [Parafrankia discariae]
MFISYRSKDTAGVYTAAYLDELLAGAFGAAAVFRSRRSVQPGDRFDEEALAALRSCEVLLAVIGPDWLPESPWEDGDWVRREIAIALTRRVVVIPVLVDGTAMPARAELPPDIVDLRRPQRTGIRRRSIDTDAASVVRAVLRQAPVLAASRALSSPVLVPPPLVRSHLPSALLRPEYGAVPFEEQDGEREALEAWAHEEPPLAARLLTGAAGLGKTRLARETCHRLWKAGWMAWLLAEDAPPGAMARALEIDVPLLIVVDPADVLVPRTLMLARELVWRRPASTRTRLLLTARSPGALLDKLCADRDDTVSALFAAMTEQRLSRHELSCSRREREFTRARFEFARRLAPPGKASDPLPDPPADLGSWRYERLLDIHVAALAQVLDSSVPDSRAPDGEATVTRTPHAASPAGARRSGPSPVARLLHHERRYWTDTATEFPLPDPHRARLDQVVTAAALFGADDEQEATRLLAGLPTFRDHPEDVVRRYVTWLFLLYGGPTGLEPLRPAPLAEHHLAMTGPLSTETVTSIIATRTDRQLQRALAVLGHGSSREPALSGILEVMVRADLTRCFPLGIDTAHGLLDPTPFVRVLETVAVDVDDTTRRAALQVLPDSTVALAALSLRLIEDELRAGPAGTSMAPTARAELLRRQASGLARAGDPYRALGPATEAVQLCHDQPDKDPRVSDRAYAEAARTRASVLGDLGRHKEALEDARSAVDAWRRLVRIDNAAPGLAGALNDLAVRLRRAGQSAYALQAAEKSTKMFEAVAADQPNRYQSYLGLSLVTYGGCLSAQGLYSEALAAYARATKIFRDLAPRRPDRHLPALAGALAAQAALLPHHRLSADDEAARSEAVAVLRRLASTRPDGFLPELAPLASTSAVLPADPGSSTQAHSEAHAVEGQLTAADVAVLYDLVGGDGSCQGQFLDTVIDGCVPVWDEDGDADPEELKMRPGEWCLDLSRVATRPELMNALAAVLMVERLGVGVSVRWVWRLVGELVDIEARSTVTGGYALHACLRPPYREGDPGSCHGMLPDRLRARTNEEDFADLLTHLRGVAEPGAWFPLSPADRRPGGPAAGGGRPAGAPG